MVDLHEEGARRLALPSQWYGASDSVETVADASVCPNIRVGASMCPIIRVGASVCPIIRVGASVCPIIRVGASVCPIIRSE
jgi:hypothetical protein